MRPEVVALDVAIEKPLFVGANIMAEENWKAVWNQDTGKVASIVSKGYEIVQHRDVAQSFLDAYANLNIEAKTRIKDHENRITIDVEFPKSRLYVQKGEEFIVGFRLINSYDKTTGVSIVPRLVRLACMNGMIVDVKGFVGTFNYRHNQEMAQNFAGYIETALKETINANDKLKAMVNDCIGDSIEWEICEKLIPLLINTKKHWEVILEDLKGDIVTRWDIYNAITKYATHNEQLKPNIEAFLQEKAQRVLTTPLMNLVKLNAIEVPR